MLKKIFSCSLAIVLALLGVFTGGGDYRHVSAAEQIEWTDVFEEIEPGNKPGDGCTIYATASWVKNLKAKLGESTELIFPNKYALSESYLTDVYGLSKEEAKEFSVEAPLKFRPGALSNKIEQYTENVPQITSIVFGAGMGSFSAGDLFRFPNVEKVTFNAEGLSLKNSLVFLDGYSNENDKNTYASKLTEIYIEGSTIGTIEADAFKYINENVKIHVKSKDIRDAILTATKDGTAPLKDENVIDDTAELPMPEFEINCPNIHKGEVFAKPTISIIDGKGDESAEVIIDPILYLDEACTQRSSYYYYTSGISEGTYYLKVTLGATEKYQSLTKVTSVQVIGNEEVNKTALDAAIAETEQFYADNQYNQGNYKTDDWDNVFASSGALARAKYISADKDGGYTQAQVDEATTNLTNALDALKKSVADNTEAWNKLQEAITKAEAVILDKDKYTEESWAKVNPQHSIDDAKALKKDTATVVQIESMIRLLQFNGLELKQVGPVVEPGTPFAYIKKGSQVKVLSMTAPEKLAGATKIRVTFQCAEDVSFNEHASIDINPIIAGEDNYLQIKGTGGYETGKTYTVEVPLSAAIKAGDSIEIIMTTFSWDDAKDYVYGITAIEFVDADDKALGSYIDKDVFKENLATAIKEAEAINTSTYTDESVKKLTDALAAAKALKEDATAEEMKQVIDAINDAIKGLQKKDEDEEARAKLTAKLKEAEAIDTSLYTAESVEKLTKALEAAKALKEDASAEEINQVLTAIDEAIKGLVKKDGGTPAPSEQVIGVAKGKTFTAGSFNYKVSTAATITGTVKKAGKVTLVGLSKASKNKSSINVKNTISASGASYQVTAIGSKAFAKAPKLKKVTLGSNIKSIPTGAFMSCKKLTTVKATGVTKIGKNAFKGCKVLKKLTFGKKKVSSVKKGAFKGCKKTIKVAGGSKKVRKGNVKKLKKSGYKKFK